MSEESMRSWITEEQEQLWCDLEDAIRAASNRAWSITSAGIAERIATAARLVGLTPYTEVPWTLLAGRVYEALAECAGLEARLPTGAEWGEMEGLMLRNGGSRIEAEHRMSRTVKALRADTAWVPTS